MNRAESHGCPARAPDNSFSSAALIPLLLLLHGNLPSENENGAGSTIAGEQGQDEVAAEEIEATQDQIEMPPAEVELPSELPSEPTGELDEEPGLAAEDLASAQPEDQLDGYINLRTRSRWAKNADDSDHDVYAVVGVDYVPAEPDGFGVHVLLHGSWGANSQDTDSVFYSVEDTYAHRLHGRVYYAYADVPVGPSLEVARIGRMAIYETPAAAYFDGAHVETAPVGPTQFVVGAYGGLSAHHFEDWPSEEGMGGMYTRFRPWVDGLMRFDWMRLTDDDRYGEGDNDLLSGGLTHRLGDLSLEGDYTLLDGDSHDMEVKGLWLWPEQDMSVRLSHYRLLEKQENLAFELNPYYNILNTYYPYDESQLTISKAFSDSLELYGGVNTRRVDDDGDIGRYNRDYDRFYLTAALPEVLPGKTTLSFTGEVWDSPDNDIETWGLDLTTQLNEETRLSLGSYYSLYKYFFDIDDEREDVRTFYAGVRNKASESMNLMARYEYEDEEIDSYHSLRLGVSWRF